MSQTEIPPPALADGDTLSTHPERFRVQDGTLRAQVTGTAVWARSTRDDSDCICCEGPHVYTRYLALPAELGTSFDGSLLTSSCWLNEVASKLPEGSRVRVTVEVITEG